MAMKMVVADPKSGRCVQKELSADVASKLMGMKIGDALKGDVVGISGYEFVITGGSDYAGFPMRRDVPGTGRKRVLAVSGVGMKKKGKGIKQRKTVCGNTMHQRIAQVNVKILKEGSEKLFEVKEEAKEAKQKKEMKEAKEVKEVKAAAAA